MSLQGIGSNDNDMEARKRFTQLLIFPSPQP
jgi:hypothetical protein